MEGQYEYNINQLVISWPYFSEYEIVTAPNGKRYIRPTEKSTAYRFHFRVEQEQRVIDAINVGMLVLGQKSEEVIEKAVLDFVAEYSLLGPMTALPSSPDFMEYEVAFLPKKRNRLSL